MAKLSEVSPVKPVVPKKRKNKNKKKKAKAVQNEKPDNVEDVDTSKVSEQTDISDELAEKYPLLKNEELVNKFLGVTMTNNQKGRIRQQLRDNLKGTSEVLLPEVIHNRIQAIVKDIITLTDAELRKIRILYNMLKTSVQTGTTAKVTKKKKNKKNKKKKENVHSEGEKEGTNIDNAKDTTEKDIVKDTANKEKLKDSKNIDKTKDTNKDKSKDDANKEAKGGDKKEKDKSKKGKGPKRYVVFVGNLPLDIDKENIMHHFYELRDHIVDVRIQKPAEGKKSCIAYVELKNEPSYELALSKHHSMLNNRRINVLYTTQQNSKISKTEAKSKSAKLIALQKSGKLMGSVPLHKKRSHRRMIAKKARAKLEADS